jgi:hypothetical protein
MSQPPVHPSSGYPDPGHQPYPGYGQHGGQPSYQDGQPSYPGYGQQGNDPRYQDSGQQSYPGYGQPAGDPRYQGGGQQSYPGYGQPPGDPRYQDSGQQSYPGYGQPAGQSYPGYSEPARETYPGYSQASAPPPKKSKAGKIVLIVVAVLVLVCGGGSAVAYFAFKDDVSEVVDASQTRLVAPETLAGRPKIKNPDLQEVADKMIADMKKDVPGATSTIGAFYGDPAKEDMVMIAGASALVADPAKQLDEAITGLGAGGLKVSNVKSVEPGPLGGVAKCGDAKADDVPVGVCVWSDRGSLGVVAVYFKTGDQANAELVKIRSEVEQRS